MRYIAIFLLVFIGSTGISSAQNVGIGTAVPGSKLSISGNLSVGSGYAGTAAPANGAIIEGNVGIGTTTPAQKLDVVGNVQFSGALMPAGDPGTSGQVLTSTGAGSPPTWTTLSVSGGGNTGCSDCVTMISPVSSTTMIWGQCAQYCRDGTWGGYTDWRMPTLEEAIDYTSGNVDASLSAGTFPFNQNIWTSTQDGGTWYIFTESTGRTAGTGYNMAQYCRCVR